jgi:hypothetical protein
MRQLLHRSDRPARARPAEKRRSSPTRATAVVEASLGEGVFPGAGATLHKRRVNALIEAGSGDTPTSAPIAFLCECDSHSCLRTVWLTPADYGASRHDLLESAHPQGAFIAASCASAGSA